MDESTQESAQETRSEEVRMSPQGAAHVRLGVLVGIVVIILSGCAAEEAGRAQPIRSAPPVTVESETEESDHEEDYDAPVEELVQHADHLDLARLEPAKRAALEELLAKRAASAAALWESYAGAITGTPSTEMPAELAALSLDELGYVLLTERTRALALGVHQAGSLEAARARPEIGPEAPGVEVEVAESYGQMCVQLRWAEDPFARGFSAAAGVEAPGSLQARIERSVYVGDREVMCEGVAPSYSPAATAALEAIEELQSARSGR